MLYVELQTSSCCFQKQFVHYDLKVENIVIIFTDNFIKNPTLSNFNYGNEIFYTCQNYQIPIFFFVSQNLKVSF